MHVHARTRTAAAAAAAVNAGPPRRLINRHLPWSTVITARSLAACLLALMVLEASVFLRILVHALNALLNWSELVRFLTFYSYPVLLVVNSNLAASATDQVHFRCTRLLTTDFYF